MPASPTAIAILEFGKLLHDEERRYKKDRDGAKIQQAEEQLIGMLISDRSPSIKQIFNFNVGKPVEPIVVRVLSHVAYLSLCSNRLGIAVSDIVRVVAGEEPAAVLEARQTISKLLIAKQLCLKNGYNIELGRPLLDFLAGGKQAPPLVMCEWDLHGAWHKAKSDAIRRRAHDT